MSLIKRFLLSKKGRIAALAILGFAFFSFAAIVLVSEIFGFGEDEGKVYRKLEGDRVLLMNRDANTLNPILYQGYADTVNNRTFWWELLDKLDVALYNLKNEHHSRLRMTGENGKILWELKNCRHGNTYAGSNVRYHNYLPFSSTSYTIDETSGRYQTAATAATAGQIVMQNTPDAQVISSCYADGIGTIYFDAVNAFTGYKKGQLEVEVAYGVWKTNEAGVVANRDESSRNVENDIERDADDNVVLISEENSHEIYKSATGNVVTNPYARCAWVKANMTGRYWSDGIPGVIPTNTVLKLELPLSGGIYDAGKMNSFYRIWAPVQDAGINPHLASYCRGPMRFRIRRADKPWDGSRIPEGDLDGKNIEGNPPLEPYNGLILIDNVIASFPAMKAEAVARGEYAKGLSDRGNVGWIDVLSTRCPAVGEEGLKVRAGLIVSSNTPPEQAINYNADEWVTKATWKYRWRYLDQVTNDWREVELLPGPNGLESTETLKMEDKVGDVEFYYNADLNAPYYGYVDYSGSNKGTPGYTERIKSVEARFNPGWLGQEGLPLTLPSLGTDFFFRLREGKSEQLSYKLELRKAGTAEIIEREFWLTGNNTWRSLHQTPTNEESLGAWEFRVIGVNPQNCWGGSPVTGMPVTGQKLMKSAAADDCWTSFNVDAATGYLMFQLNEDPNVESQMSYSIVHADYQDFTHWNSAKKEYFVGTYTDNEKKTGASSAAKDYPGELPAWNATSAENDALWTEKFFPGASATPGNGYNGKAAYVPFTSIRTPNGWSSGPGMWVCAKYHKDESTPGGDMALQMQGQGYGALEFVNTSVPHGLETVSFKARVAQFGAFNNFARYTGKSSTSMLEYIFTARVIMSEDGTANAFDGSGVVSLLGYYQGGVGCYEVRVERIDENAVRLSLWKWFVQNGQVVSREVCRSALGIKYKDIGLQKDSKNFGSLFIHCKTEGSGTSGKTVITGGLSSKKLAYDTKSPDSSYYLVKFEDKTSNRLTFGDCGFYSLNCPAQILRPELRKGSFNPSATWKANSEGSYSSAGVNVTFPSTKEDLFTRQDVGGMSIPGYLNWDNLSNYERIELGDDKHKGVKAMPTTNAVEILVRGKTSDDWKSVGTNIVEGFGLKTYEFSVHSKDDTYVRLQMLGSISDVRSDVVIDDVKLRQWRGESYDDAGNVNFPNEKLPQLGCPSNYVYLTSWVNAEGDVRTIDLQPMRARNGDVIAVRAPLMDGLDGRGIGLGMFSFSYKNADTNCVLKLQYTKMNGPTSLRTYTASLATNDWTDVAKWDFSTMTDKERASGTLSHYLGMHGFQGVMRLIVDPQVIADSQDPVKNPKNDVNYGKITLTGFLTRDEPVLDDRSWWGWNLRSSDAPAERIIYDGVASEAKLALVLNSKVTDDVPPNGLDPDDKVHALYPHHVPFVQSPTFGTNIVGEIAFKARKFNPADANAVVAIIGARSGGVTMDSEWKLLKSFVVSNAFYENFTYKTDPGQDFASFRVAVIGVDGVVRNYADELPEDSAPLRILVDEVIVSEAVRARIGFRDVAAFRSGLDHEFMISNATDKVEQPLCKESWGVQCEVFIAQLEDEVDKERGFDVRLHWFDGTNPWGFENWKTNAAAKSAWLARAKGTDAWVFRSGYLSAPEAVIPPSMKATTVQYMLEVQYYSASGAPVTNFLTAADWNEGRGPAWYSPVNYNSGRDFSAYNILDTVSPGWAWINEVNVFGVYDRNWMNSDENRQYVEVAMPAEADLSGWKLRMLDANIRTGEVYTNTVATFGEGELPGVKLNLKNMASNCVFMVVGSPNAARSGSLNAAAGELDGVWSFRNASTSAFSSDTVQPLYPVAVQLVRPSNIVEHEVLLIGTNVWEGTSNDADTFKPQEYLDFFHARGSRMVYAGAEHGGDANSLSVLSGSGATSNDWSCSVVRTPGRINAGQAINPVHPTPFGSMIMIYSNLGSSGRLSQMIGGAPVKNNEIIFCRKGSEEGTNLVYVADMWHELGSVKIDGRDAAWTTNAPRTYTVNVGAGSSNNTITVDAEAVIQKNLETDYGLTRDNRYTKAILEWLCAGKDLKGNPWANPGSGELKLAEYWPWAAHDESERLPLSLTAMYWLDIDPTEGGWVFRAGTTDIVGEIDPATGSAPTSSSAVTNVRISVSMMITNVNEAAGWPAHKTAHAPRALRGLEPGSSSLDYADADYGWTSVTFKVTSIMFNDFIVDGGTRENRVPLRWFVFDEDSFGGADGFTSTIDFRHPWSGDSLSGEYGYKDWLERFGEEYVKKHGRLPFFGYAWDIDERLKPVSVEILKPDSTLKR